MSDYTTVSFKKDFVEDIRDYIDETSFGSVRSFLEHVAVKEMESEEAISESEAKKIGQKLKDLGYVE